MNALEPNLNSFDESDAWRLGSLMRELADKRNYPVAIDIRSGDTPLFSVLMPGATEVNFNWARRKRNLVLLTGRSTWFHQEHRLAGNDILVEQNLDPANYASHGGGVPIYVDGKLAATVVVSGLPSKEDHDFVIECLELLGAD